MTKKEIVQSYREQKSVLYENFKMQKAELNAAYNSQLEAYRIQEGKPAVIDPPKRPVLEEIGNSVTHGVGTIFSIIAYILMLVSADTAKEFIGASIYFFGLFVLFTMSCLYHAFKHGSAVKRVFRRFDYSSIYLLIGATFAPILLCYVGGTYGTVFLIVQWLIIATGITFIGIFGPSKLKALHMTLYIVLGWSGLMFLPQMIKGDFGFFFCILLGGVIYSLGIIPFSLKKKSSHFIWHFFVLGGAIVQWLGIYLYLYL